MDLTITPATAAYDHRGPVHAVWDDDLAAGYIVHTGTSPASTRHGVTPRWRVKSAGAGVHFTGGEHDTAQAAAAEIIAARAADPALTADHTGLTGAQRTVLDIAGRGYPPGGREAAARAELGVSIWSWAQMLHALLDRPEAHAYAPAAVEHHRRVAAARAAVHDRRVTAA